MNLTLILYKPFNIIFFITILLIIIFVNYYNKIYVPKKISKRRNKVYSLLERKYGKAQILNDNKLKFIIHNRIIIFHYYACTIPGQKTNRLNIYLDISHLEDKIKNLCEIHFHCHVINKKLYIVESVPSYLNNSIKYLVMKSENSINKILSESEKYIKEKL